MPVSCSLPTIKSLSSGSGEVGEDSERISYHTDILRSRLPTLVLNALSGWRGWRGRRGCFSSSYIEKMISGQIDMVKTQAGFQGKQPLRALRALQTFLLSVKFSYFVWIRGLWSVVVQREVPRPHRTIEALSEVAGEGGEGVERISYYTEILKTCQLTLVFSVLLLS